MTTRDMAQMTAGAIVGAALVAGGLFLARFFADDEPGIRVKNGGSVLIETRSRLLSSITLRRWWRYPFDTGELITFGPTCSTN